jgi:hypothetical protein
LDIPQTMPGVRFERHGVSVGSGYLAVVVGPITAVIKARMPALQNVRYERFCQNIATSPKTGWPQGRCYVEAGYKTADRSADACAARLLTRANIQARIAELLAPTVKKTRATIDTLAEQFDAVFEGAMSNAQFGAAGAAAAAKSKLLGFMRDKLEVGGVGSFDQCQTIEEAVAVFLSDQTPTEALELLDVLRGQVEAYAASHATLVPASEPARSVPGGEAERSLAYLRPKHRRR